MSDYERFVDLYKSIGIDIKQSKSDDKQDLYLTLTAYEGDVDGYNCFYTEISFDVNGKFVKQGIWE